MQNTLHETPGTPLEQRQRNGTKARHTFLPVTLWQLRLQASIRAGYMRLDNSTIVG